MPLYIGVDSGTQSTKAVVLDLASRQVIAEARAPHRLIAGLPRVTPSNTRPTGPRRWIRCCANWPGGSTRGGCWASAFPASSTALFPSMPAAR